MFFKKNSTTSQTENKPLPPIKDLFRKSWAVFREKLKVLTLMSLVGAIPSLLVAIILAMMATFFGEYHNFLLINSILALVMILGLIYVSFRINIAIYLIVAKNLSSVKEAWVSASKYFWSYTLTVLWLSAMIVLWFVLLLIPGFVFLVFYSMVLWVFVMEHYHGWAAIQRSRELVTGYWKAMALRLLALLVPFFLISILIDAIVKKETADLISSIINFFFGIFVTIYTYQLYKHLVQIKGPSKILQSKYPAWAYVATILVYLVLLIALYLWVVFLSNKAN